MTARQTDGPDVFGSAYAAAYDSLYHDKDYAAEAALLWETAERFIVPARSIERVLDLGCGTGSHVVELAKRAVHVTGVDRSHEMLERAKAKVAGAGVAERVTLVAGDVRDVRIAGAPFDVVVMAFAVLGYQATPAETNAALRVVRAHLRQGGVFLFDVWFGPAVLAQRPEPRTKTVESDAGDSIKRVATAKLDLLAQTVDVAYVLDRGRERTTETHRMRFFFPRELELLMKAADMELLALAAFPGGGAPESTTWNVLGVARAEASPR